MIIYHENRTSTLDGVHVLYWLPITMAFMFSSEGVPPQPAVGARQRYFIGNVGTLMGIR